MNNNNYERGKIKTGQESKNRYTTSQPEHYKRVSSIAIIVGILALIVVSCAIFAIFYEKIVSVGRVERNDEELLPPKSPYIASEGGDDLSDVYLYSEFAILVRLSDMSTIAHQDADTQMSPASMTKVMTVLVALDLLKDIDDVDNPYKKLDDEYIFHPSVLNSFPKQELLKNASTADMLYMYNTYIGDLECERYTVRDLIYGISYRSGADSIVCLLDYLGLTHEEFTDLMNEKSKEIGLENTIFGGPIGRDSEGNKTTCRDMAAIMAYAMENPLCKEFFGGVSYRPKNVKTVYYNRTLYNTLNQMGKTPENVLYGDYTIIATKSGLEDDAGYCLVSCIENNETGERFILVTAKASKGASAPSENPIYDMRILFKKYQP